MGKNLIQQKRGRGSPTFRVRSFRSMGNISHPSYKTASQGEVMDIVHSYMHTSPIARVRYPEQEVLVPAPEGMKVGSVVAIGKDASPDTGNTLALRDIPEGTFIFNIESKPGDGGKFVRASGTFAKILAKMEDKVVIILPSKKQRDFNPECRATVGIISGSGRLDKPFLKAGAKFHRMKARNKYYPQVQGVSMNAVSHPFGSKSSRTKGRPTQSARNDPPGRKVGKIAPRRTGWKR